MGRTVLQSAKNIRSHSPSPSGPSGGGGPKGRWGPPESPPPRCPPPSGGGGPKGRRGPTRVPSTVKSSSFSGLAPAQVVRPFAPGALLPQAPPAFLGELRPPRTPPAVRPPAPPCTGPVPTVDGPQGSQAGARARVGCRVWGSMGSGDDDRCVGARFVALYTDAHRTTRSRLTEPVGSTVLPSAKNVCSRALWAPVWVGPLRGEVPAKQAEGPADPKILPLQGPPGATLHPRPRRTT